AVTRGSSNATPTDFAPLRSRSSPILTCNRVRCGRLLPRASRHSSFGVAWLPHLQHEDPLMANHDYEVHEHDVIVIGAGGAGLRAAIEAAAQGVSVGLVCKSLLGKAHTVMAEGGIAAALGNVWPEDNWQVHFRDTMRGGKMLNNWRMAQLHAQEA